MSRLAKQPIVLPAGVTARVVDGEVAIKGPLGELARVFPPEIKIDLTGDQITLTPPFLTPETKALWGTVAAHLKNMVAGVTLGFGERLVIEGIGYRANVDGKKLSLGLGFSHPLEVKIPDGLKVTVEKNIIAVSGLDKEAVGQFAARIRAFKKPEPYKGKGIRYETETVRRKVGKKAAAAV